MNNIDKEVMKELEETGSIFWLDFKINSNILVDKKKISKVTAGKIR